MIFSLLRVFFADPIRALRRSLAHDVAVAASLVRRVVRPDAAPAPDDTTILVNAKEFFSFISHWVVVQISWMEMSGTDSNLLAEFVKYMLLLVTYVAGFSVNYLVVSIGRLWSKEPITVAMDAAANFYNLMFWFAFLLNLAFGKIDPDRGETGHLQTDILVMTFLVVGIVFFVILKMRKMPMRGLTWFLVMVTDVLIHVFNLNMLNLLVYQAF